MTSSQPATCRGSAAVASDKPRYIRSSYFIVANANRPEYAAIGPTDRDAQVRDHPQPDMRVRFPGFVLESVRDEQRLTGLHDSLAKRSRIESARLARISFGRAGDENFDVGRIDPHYGGRGHVQDLGKEIHNLLPFPDDFRGHFDRMCHARAGRRRAHDPMDRVLGITGDGRPVGSEAVLSRWILPFMRSSSRA